MRAPFPNTGTMRTFSTRYWIQTTPLANRSGSGGSTISLGAGSFSISAYGVAPRTSRAQWSHHAVPSSWRRWLFGIMPELRGLAGEEKVRWHRTDRPGTAERPADQKALRYTLSNADTLDDVPKVDPAAARLRAASVRLPGAGQRDSRCGPARWGATDIMGRVAKKRQRCWMPRTRLKSTLGPSDEPIPSCGPAMGRAISYSNLDGVWL